MVDEVYLRSGSWNDPCWYVRCASWLRNIPDNFDYDVGFRLVKAAHEHYRRQQTVDELSLKGGFWGDDSVNKYATKLWGVPDLLDYNIGFRIAQTMHKNNWVHLRGGSWYDDDRQLVNCAYRCWYLPDLLADNIGFRVAKVAHKCNCQEVPNGK